MNTGQRFVFIRGRRVLCSRGCIISNQSDRLFCGHKGRGWLNNWRLFFVFNDKFLNSRLPMTQLMWADRGMFSSLNSINYKHFLCIRISERLPNCITYILDTKRKEGANGFIIMLLLLFCFRFGSIKLRTVSCNTYASLD